MADDIKKPEDEIAALKARVEELERANKRPKPFVPEPYQRYDPTAGMSMPRSALEAMIAAEPRGFMQGVVGDNRAPSGRAGAIPDSQQVSNVRGGGGPVGWQHSVVSQIIDQEIAEEIAAAPAGPPKAKGKNAK